MGPGTLRAMGRLTAWTLIAVFASLALAIPAKAAEIPPTAVCSETVTEEIARYVRAGGIGGDREEVRRANNRLADNLAKAGCVSDAGPLRKWAKPDPYSEQCLEAAAAAGKFFRPTALKIRSMKDRLKAKGRQLDARARKLGQRIRQLRRNGAAPKRIEKLQRKRMLLLFKSGILGFREVIEAFEAVQPKAAATTLTVFELISLRCVGGKSYMDVMRDGLPSEEPVARVLHRYRFMINTSIFTTFFDAPITRDSARASGLGDSRVRARADREGKAGDSVVALVALTS